MSDNGFDIDSFLSQGPIAQLADQSSYNYLYSVVNESYPVSDDQAGPIQSSIFHLALVYANEALSKLSLGDGIDSEIQAGFGKAYYFFKSLDISDTELGDLLQRTLGIAGLRTSSMFYFWLASFGLLSGNNIKVRLDLEGYSSDPSFVDEQSWGDRVLGYCIDAMLFLVRKLNGMEDIRTAFESIEKLKAIQKDYEEGFISNLPENTKFEHASRLLGIYHLAKILTETAEFLISGYDYKKPLRKVIQLHSKHAGEALKYWPEHLRLVPLFEHVMIEIQQNSIWFRTQNLGSSIQGLCKRLAERSIIDLLPSQKEALEKNLLDPVSNVSIIEMPTSSGKTLLAEFNILQTRALRNDAKVIYIAPTRALVNQVWSDLKVDFEGLDFQIEKTSKVNDLDPQEDLLLKDEIDILVSTPEKIDLLIRKNHPSVADISLIIVDEAHNLADGERGARLELLLTILKRERPQAKFMLLSPFMDNSFELSKWLANGRSAIAPIKVNWKPSDKLIVGIRENKGEFMLEVIPSAHGLNLSEGSNIIPIDKEISVVSTSPKSRLREVVAKGFSSSNQSVLYLCRGKGTADKTAKEVASYFQESPTEQRTLVAKFVEDEIGRPTVLSEILNRGVAVHHAGLTEDSKQLVEYLIRKKEIAHIFATTTVAQGINFPISCVFIDDTRKGDARKSGAKNLSTSEIMNIAGRAGRTLVDNVGKVIFPFNSKTNEVRAKQYLQDETRQVISALTGLLSKAEAIIGAFSSQDAKSRAKAYQENESLAPLAQYLVHLISVSAEDSYFGELDDLFRDSFGYQSLDAVEKSRFLQICRTIYSDLQTRFSKGPLKLADSTGFSVASVLAIMNANKEQPNIANPELWKSEVLFGPNSKPLKEKIEVIAKLREVQIGTESDKSKFNADLVARILIGWVNGKNIDELSRIHSHFSEKEDSARINEFVSYLSGTSFKTSWGLSALEGIVKSKNEEIEESSHIPSMVYFGVNTPQAVAMRMLGVPRGIAGNIANFIYEGEEKKYSFSTLRDAIGTLSDRDWNSIKPHGSKLDADEWKAVTKILTR
jgi:superfamily II DNA/RNA helicase